MEPGDAEELSDIDTARTCPTVRLVGWGLSVRPVAVAVAPFQPAAVTPPAVLASSASSQRGAAAGLGAVEEDDEQELEDASLHRITALEVALGDANRELRARAETEELLRMRIEELTRVVEEQRLVLDAKDAEIVRLTSQSFLPAEAPKPRTRYQQQRRPTRVEIPAEITPATQSSVPSLPPLIPGGRSHSSMF
jgi:hypothetical protein